MAEIKAGVNLSIIPEIKEGYPYEGSKSQDFGDVQGGQAEQGAGT
jgi:hypothetical protein